MKTKTKDFLARLAGFLSVRDNLNDVAATVLPEDLASTFEPVGAGTTPIQEESLLEEHLEDPTNASIEEQLEVLSEIAKADIKPQLDAYGMSLVEQIKNTNENGEESHYPKYKGAPIKSKSRSAEKIRNEYDGVALRILDLVRASIIVNTEQQLAKLLNAVIIQKDEMSATESSHNVEVIRFKNRFQSPTFSGYRDALFNLKLTDPVSGHAMIVELQVHLAQAMVHKPASHFYYGYFRQFFSGNMDVVRARMDLLTSLGAQVKSFSLDLQHEHSKQPLQIENILQDLCIEGSKNEIDSNTLEEQMEENDEVKALIDELAPFWDLQDTLNSSTEYWGDSLERFEDIIEPLESTILTTSKESTDLSLESIYDLAKVIHPIFNEFGRILVHNATQYVDTEHFEWNESQPQDEDLGEESNFFIFEEAPLKPQEESETKGTEKYDGNFCRVRDIVEGSIVVCDEYRLESFFKYMMLLFENEQIKIVEFRNGFHKKPIDWQTSFFGYRYAIYNLLIEVPEGSMVVELKVHIEGHKKYEAQSLHYWHLFRPYLSGDDGEIQERLKLLESFEAQVKNKKGREYAGRVESMIGSFVDSGDVDGLRTLEMFMGPTMLSDMKVAILCSRERLRALEARYEEDQSVQEEILDAKLSLGANLYESSRYGEELDGFEALDLLLETLGGFKNLFEDDKHPKVLRASIYYYAAWFENMPSENPKAAEHLENFKTVLNDCVEAMGTDNETTILCKQLYAMVLSGFDGTESLRLLQEAYDDGAKSLGESHPVTLNCGCDLMFEYEYSDTKPNDLYKFTESVYKGYVVVFGRTPLALDAELIYVQVLRSTAHAHGETLGPSKTQWMIDEARRLETAHGAGIATEYLDFSFDGSWYKSTPWSEVPLDVQKAALTLGWEASEQTVPWYPTESRNWDELSVEEVKAARMVGFNRYSWAATFSGYLYLCTDWDELSETKQKECQVLGWTEENWGVASLLLAETRKWRDLTSEEKIAASELNFSVRSWNLMFAASDFEKAGGDGDGDY